MRNIYVLLTCFLIAPSLYAEDVKHEDNEQKCRKKVEINKSLWQKLNAGEATEENCTACINSGIDAQNECVKDAQNKNNLETVNTYLLGCRQICKKILPTQRGQGKK